MSELPRQTGPWFQSFTGEQINPMTLRPTQVNIADIAHALSLTCRFNGHCNQFYSVAQHCVLGSQYAEQVQSSNGLVRLARLPLLFMLHDAAEAYLIDLPRPVKYHRAPWAGEYRALEDKVQGICWDAFKLLHPTPVEEQALKEIDDMMLATEKRDLMNDFGFAWNIDAETMPARIRGEHPPLAEEQFIAQFNAVQQYQLSAIAE